MSMVLRLLTKAPTGPIYTPMYSTNWDSFAAGIAPGGTTGFGQVAQNTATMRPLTNSNYSATKGIVLANPASAVSNSRINRTETPARASMYCKGTFFANTSGPRYGLSFHGATGSGSTHMFYVQGTTGVDYFFWGTFASSTSTGVAPQTTATGMSGNTGIRVSTLMPQAAADGTQAYKLEVRATSTSTVDLYCNDILVKSGMPTTFNTTGQVAGLYMANGSGGICEYFEVGTYVNP